jgi:hypothetical protein
MKLKCRVLVYACLLLVLAACSQVPDLTTTGLTGTALPTATTIPQPEAGKGTMIGVLVSIPDQAPVPNTAVRLAEVYRKGEQGAFVLDGAYSPGDITDEQGNFIIPNIDAKEYVIVVGDVYGKYVIVAEPSGEGKVYAVAPDEITDIGQLVVDWR